MEPQTEAEMVRVKEALADCSSEVKRLVDDEVLAIPMVQHMLCTFLLDKSRSFEDWIVEPRCRYNLERLRDRAGSVDAPAVTVNYQEQHALATYERLRASTGLGSGDGESERGGGATEAEGVGGGGGSGGGDDVVAAANPDPAAAAPASAPAWAAAAMRQSVQATEGSRGDVTGGVKTSGGGSDGNELTGKERERGGEVRAAAGGVASHFSRRPSSTSSSLSSSSSSPAATTAVTKTGMLSMPPPPPSREVSRVGSSVAGANELEDAEDEGMGEDVYDMLMVMSEAIKEEAKGRFQTGDYMGAAKAYYRAATTLEDRAPPSGERHEPLRRRLREMYETCMCNAAVAGFKAAAASPAPGEAHSLVVDACSRALERSGGKCPKARFWRARVKISQRMYEAAEIDLRKAVEEEEERRQERKGGAEEEGVEHDKTRGATMVRLKGEGGEGGDTKGCSADGVSNRTSTASEGTCTTTTPNVTSTSSIGISTTSNGSATLGCSGPALADHRPSPGRGNPTVTQKAVAAADSSTTVVIGLDGGSPGPTDSSGSASAGDGVCNGCSPCPAAASAAAATETETAAVRREGNGVGGAGANGADKGGRKDSGGAAGAKTTKKKASEAARWLARVRAKIAEMTAERALATEQASARNEESIARRERGLKMAEMRARHGPGHVPRRQPGSSEAHISEGESSADDKGAQEDSDVGGGRRGESSAAVVDANGGIRSSPAVYEEEEDVVPEWKVPRPPPLKVKDRSPAMVLNTYSMQAKFQALPEYEQVTGSDGRAEYVCSIRVGPEDRIVGKGRASNMKTAKQEASRDLLRNAALAWNEENPEDQIDMELMEPLPVEESSNTRKEVPMEVTEEFKAYCAAWVEKVVTKEVHEARFPLNIDKYQRRFVHGMVEGLNNPEVLSKSATVSGRRQLSVMQKAIMEGLAFMSGDSVVVMDVPAPPTLPAAVGRPT